MNGVREDYAISRHASIVERVVEERYSGTWDVCRESGQGEHDGVIRPSLTEQEVINLERGRVTVGCHV